MSCDEVLDRLAAALTEPGREVPPDVDRHIAECPSCHARAAEIRGALDLVRGAARSEEESKDVAPPSFDRILARTRSPSRRAPRVLLRAAALILAALGGVAADRAWNPPARRVPAPATSLEGARREAVRREVVARPGGLGASLAVLAALDRKK